MQISKLKILFGCLVVVVMILLAGCVEEKNEEVQLCEKIQEISGDNKEICSILGDAVAKQDISVCKKIPDDDLWQSVCIREVAVAKQDIFLCNNISSISEQYVCTLMVAKLKQNVSLCEEVDYFWRDDCIREVAVAKQNATLCNEIHDSNKKRTCVDDIAAAKNKQHPTPVKE